MKKIYLILAAALGMTFTSCTTNDYVGDVSPTSQEVNDGAIRFSTSSSALTRGDFTGAEAADKLKNQFVVGGFKGSTSVATTTVFDNYNVQYLTNTANTTESNTNNWEYVGLDPNSLTTITSAGKQTIKYWDYSAAQYDFIAYSLGGGTATATTITPSTATSSTGGAYTITGTTEQLSKVYIADLATVLKANYNQPVRLSFRNLVAKVRLGLYETIPGYSVKDVKFYSSDAAISGGSTSTTPVLYAGSEVLPLAGTYTIYFPTVNDATPASDKNKAHVACGTPTSKQSSQKFDGLTYTGDKERLEPGTDKFLGRTSNAASYAGAYQDVLPYETGTSLTLKVDYTLYSIDGTNETIKVVGAKAVVPAIYAQWKPGFAYTYLFKISDNTNGYTSGVEGSEVQGLHAITFDAVVEQTTLDNIQETVTTVATPSITTYQHVPAVNASANNEYIAGTIYAMVMNEGTLKTDLNTAPVAKFYELDKVATEAEVMDALLMRKGEGTSFKGRNGLELTNLVGTSKIDNTITAIPGADGNDITVTAGSASKLTVEAGKTYAYVYTSSASTSTEEKYEAISATAGTTDVNGYYTRTGTGTTGDPYVYTQITTTTMAATGVTYYDKYFVNNGVYAVKVIKVKA